MTVVVDGHFFDLGETRVAEFESLAQCIRLRLDGCRYGLSDCFEELVHVCSRKALALWEEMDLKWLEDNSLSIYLDLPPACSCTVYRLVANRPPDQKPDGCEEQKPPSDRSVSMMTILLVHGCGDVAKVFGCGESDLCYWGVTRVHS